MRYLIVADDASPEVLRESINLLRAKQLKACIQSTRVELGDEIDELLERLPKATA